MIASARVVLLLVFCLSANLSKAQNAPSIVTPALPVSTLVAQAHYDQLVLDFSQNANEAIKFAMDRGYYIPIAQREQLLIAVGERFNANRLRQAFVAQLQSYALAPGVKQARNWYASALGRKVLAGVQPAYAPEAGKRQRQTAAALQADQHLLRWAELYQQNYGLPEQWLQQRQQLRMAVLTHIAKALKPHTPFDQAIAFNKMQQETFELRPEVYQLWLLRFLDSVDNLEVTELLRYEQFTQTDDYGQFIERIKEASAAVYVEQGQALLAMFDEIVLPKPIVEEEPELPSL